MKTNDHLQSTAKKNIFASGACGSATAAQVQSGLVFMNAGPIIGANIAKMILRNNNEIGLDKKYKALTTKAPFFVPIGYKSWGIISPDNAPMGGGIVPKCCGFPGLLLCPCFWKCPLACGICCDFSSPSGPATGNCIYNLHLMLLTKDKSGKAGQEAFNSFVKPEQIKMM